jgi:hypothetical protein
MLVLLAAAVGLTALLVTPREEDPQIVVPLADVYVDFPGHAAPTTEQLVATPLEKLLFQIDGVEYVYSMSRDDRRSSRCASTWVRTASAVWSSSTNGSTNTSDIVPPGVTGWVVKPVEIDDVPIVTLTLTSETTDGYVHARRVGRGDVAPARRGGGTSPAPTLSAGRAARVYGSSSIPTACAPTAFHRLTCDAGDPDRKHAATVGGSRGAIDEYRVEVDAAVRQRG